MIRSYHGHLSGVYCVTTPPHAGPALHGRSRQRVSRVGHPHEGGGDGAGGPSRDRAERGDAGGEPQVVTGSADATVRTWDLLTGQATSILTHHKKGVRAVAFHPE